MASIERETSAALSTRLEEARRELQELDRRREDLVQEIQSLEARAEPKGRAALSPQEKVSLFRSFFRGREDAYPRRWESKERSGYSPACGVEWQRPLCQKPRVRCSDCQHRELLPVSDDVVRWHLRGESPLETRGPDGMRPDFTIGVYPLLQDSSTWLLAADFDKAAWEEDLRAFAETCRTREIPVLLERSRSCRGGHAWIFFSTPVPARSARLLGSGLLTETQSRRPELGMDSYDRLFPTQDALPEGGFGNLIALPLQKRCRDLGGSVFLDQMLQEVPDPWAHLQRQGRLSPEKLDRLLEELPGVGGDLFSTAPSSPTPQPSLPLTSSEPFSLTLADQLYLPRHPLPAEVRARLIRHASFENPTFHRNRALRISNHDTPRFICRAEVEDDQIVLPRGLLDQVRATLSESGIRSQLEDRRQEGAPLIATFRGQLRPRQQEAAEAILEHDLGVLAAPTGFGKTVLGAYLIAQRATSTLVLVHRRQLLDQWRAQLGNFLELPDGPPGQIGGGRNAPTGKLDVATLQTLTRMEDPATFLAGYGQILVDECHHISAFSFEEVIRRACARYIAGLSATPVRKDGHHPILFMQCGPIRWKVDPRTLAAERPFSHRVQVRRTGFRTAEQEDRPKIQQLYKELVQDGSRNAQIVDDVITAVDAGRSPVVLTERREHVTALAETLEPFVRHLFVLHGGLSAKARRETLSALQELPREQERLLIATGRYLGEGIDDPRLDTLFLTLPISWRGTLAQYVGRLHRTHEGKREVQVYDYLDSEVPTLAKMFERRRRGYRSLGYEIEGAREPTDEG